MKAYLKRLLSSKERGAKRCQLVGILVFAILVGCAPKQETDRQSDQERERMRVFRDGVRHQVELLADQTIGRSNVCPVHDEVMKTQSVKMVYGLLSRIGPEPSFDLRNRTFPYATEWVAAGCMVDDSLPKKADVLQCSTCLREQRAWYTASPK